jgi:hypothetical protein
MGLILILVVLLILLAALPAWPYSRSWGYGPGSILSAVLLILILLMLFGLLTPWFPAGPGVTVYHAP